jgi:hypothetical protein
MKKDDGAFNWRLCLQTSGIYRDPAIPVVHIKTGGRTCASRPSLAPKSALRLHPCRALSSAPVSPRVKRARAFVKLVIVVGREK